MKTLAVYNCCQISRRDNTAFYQTALRNLLRQDVHVCIQGCMMTDETKKILEDEFARRMSILWIDEPQPLNVSFNLAVTAMRELVSDWTHVVYLASDVDVGDSDLSELCRVVSGECMCASAVVDNDSGYEWLGITPPAKGSILCLPPGKTVNLHAQVWSVEFLTSYPQFLPDIFVSHCSEQVTPYLCSAIHCRFVLAPVSVHHASHMDGPSSGFPHGTGIEVKLQGPKNIHQLIDEGRSLGWGFEEYLGVLNHDPDKFDENGYALDNRLHGWLRDNMFLKTDYRNIKRLLLA